MSFALGGTPIGSHQKLEVAQQQQTATDFNAKQGLMLVKDTLEVPFTKMQGGDKYRASQNKPMLPMYVSTSLTRAAKGDNPWIQVLKELAGKLPNDVKYLLQKDLDQPKELRDQTLESLKKSLQFASKGLNWARDCKGLKNKIKEEDRRKREQADVNESLGFYRTLLTVTNEVTKALKNSMPEKEYLLQLALRIPPVMMAIGAKRERKRTKEVSSVDEVILKEIDEINAYLDKSMGEKRPLIAGFLVSHLEVIHQLSYPKLNYNLFNTLWLHYQVVESESSILNKTLNAFLKISDSLNQLIPLAPFEKEGMVLIAELIAISVMVLDQNESKKEFSFYLGLHMLVVSTFFQETGKALFKGLLIDTDTADWLQSLVLAISGGVIYLLSKTRKLEEKESSQIFDLMKETFFRAAFVTSEKKTGDGVNVVCLKLMSAIESDDEEGFLKECQRILNQIGLKVQDLEVAMKGVKKVYQTIEEELSNEEKERQKLTFSARSA